MMSERQIMLVEAWKESGTGLQPVRPERMADEEPEPDLVV